VKEGSAVLRWRLRLRQAVARRQRPGGVSRSEKERGGGGDGGGGGGGGGSGVGGGSVSDGGGCEGGKVHGSTADRGPTPRVGHRSDDDRVHIGQWWLKTLSLEPPAVLDIENICPS